MANGEPLNLFLIHLIAQDVPKIFRFLELFTHFFFTTVAVGPLCNRSCNRNELAAFLIAIFRIIVQKEKGVGFSIPMPVIYI